MNYGELFEKAWKIIWRHKVLWIFGILASCSTRSGGGGGGGGSGTNFRFNGNQNFQNLPPQWQQFFFNLDRGLQNGTFWAYFAGFIGVVIVVGILLWLIFLALGVFGRVGLIKGAWLADEGAPRLTFSGLWNTGSHYFWRVFWFLLIFSIVMLLVWLILFIPIIIIGLCTLCIGFIVVWLIGWLIYVWVELSIVAIVGEDLAVMDGIRRAWDVITHNWGPVALVTVIVAVGSFILHILIGLPFVVVAIPIIIAVGQQTQAAMTNSFIAALALFCIYLPIAIFLGGVLQSYIGSVWTLLYRRLTGRTGEILPVPSQPVTPEAPAEQVQPGSVDIIEPDDTD